MKIENWFATLEREAEDCVFEIRDGKPCCVICGKRRALGMKQWHPGPILTLSGSFESPECREPNVEPLDAHFITHNGKRVDLPPDMPIFITSRESIEDGIYRYSFAGKRIVEVPAKCDERPQGSLAPSEPVESP